MIAVGVAGYSGSPKDTTMWTFLDIGLESGGGEVLNVALKGGIVDKVRAAVKNEDIWKILPDGFLDVLKKLIISPYKFPMIRGSIKSTTGSMHNISFLGFALMLFMLVNV